MEFLTAYNLWGLTTGISTFLIIGLFHPIVIKAEYYFGTGCWWAFLAAGLALTGVSVLLDHLFLSTLAGVVAFSCFWSIIEILEQARRVETGWFPAKPQRKKKK